MPPIAACRRWPTEETSRRNLHRPKAATSAKEEGTSSGKVMGTPNKWATSACTLAPSSNESPGKIMVAPRGEDLLAGEGPERWLANDRRRVPRLVHATKRGSASRELPPNRHGFGKLRSTSSEALLSPASWLAIWLLLASTHSSYVAIVDYYCGFISPTRYGVVPWSSISDKAKLFALALIGCLQAAYPTILVDMITRHTRAMSLQATRVNLSYTRQSKQLN